MQTNVVVPAPGTGAEIEAVIGEARRRQRRRYAATAAFLFARTGWSARASWLLYQGPGTHRWGCQVSTGQVRSPGTPCCQYTAMATVKSPPSS